MSSGAFLIAMTVGTALLALWSYVRWPGAAPASMKGALVRVALAFVLLQVVAAGLTFGVAAAPSLAILFLVAAVLPALTYAFLASIWFLKVCADQFRGAA
jgi:hypothetical protein